MLAEFLLKGGLSAAAKAAGQSSEEFYLRKVNQFGDTTDHDAQTAALKTLGIVSEFRKDMNKARLIESVKKGIPMVIGTDYSASGHIIVVVGYMPGDKFYIHDPYGKRSRGDTDSWASRNSPDGGENGQGKYDVYDMAMMNKVYWDLGPNAGWGRVVKSVKGVSTGL
jgi:hypothetical protein